MSDLNLPLHRIHCIDWGYGILLIPVRTGWLCWRTDKLRGFRIARHGRFHNCTRTGVY